VSGTSYVGGLVGCNEHYGTVCNSFWDVETSGMTSSAGGTGKTTDNMKNVRTFTDITWSEGLTSPWDFVGNPYDDVGNEDIWDINPAINDGYPFFNPSSPPADTTPPTSSVSPSGLWWSSWEDWWSYHQDYPELRVTIYEDQSQSGLTYRIYYRYSPVYYSPVHVDEDGRMVYFDVDGRIHYMELFEPFSEWILLCDDYHVDWYDGYGVATVQFYPMWGSGYYQFRSIAIDGAGNADWQSFGSIPPHDDFGGLYNDYAHRINLRVDEQALDPDSAHVEYSYKVSCDCSVGIEEGQVKLQGLSSETGQWETLYLKPPPILEGVVAADLPPGKYSRVGLYIYAELEGGSSINGLFTVMWNRTIT